MSKDQNIRELIEIDSHYKFLIDLSGLDKVDENGFEDYAQDKLDLLDYMFYKYCNKDVSDECAKLIEKLKENVNILFDRLQAEAKQKLN